MQRQYGKDWIPNCAWQYNFWKILRASIDLAICFDMFIRHFILPLIEPLRPILNDDSDYDYNDNDNDGLMGYWVLTFSV